MAGCLLGSVVHRRSLALPRAGFYSWILETPKYLIYFISCLFVYTPTLLQKGYKFTYKDKE